MELSALPNPINQFIQNQVVNKSKAALVVGFVNPNGTKVFNFGNLSNVNNIPANGNTLFNIGSITKTFTTLILADFVKKGQVDLDDPVEKYLPSGIKIPSYTGNKITLENLATHTSGLPDFPSNIWLDEKSEVLKPNYDTNQFYSELSNFDLTRKPGSQFQYSSFGMALLAHALSLKANVPYEHLVKDRILDVLGMDDTKINLSQDDIKNRLPAGHYNGSETNIMEIPEIMAGAGAFCSTVNDLLKYLSANLGFLHTKLDEAIQLQHLVQHPCKIVNSINFNEYIALGWRVLTNFGSETLTHIGVLPGWNAFVGFTPVKKIGVVLLGNCDSKDVDMEKLGFILLNLMELQNFMEQKEKQAL